jgi:hypothetical protein
MQGCNNRIGQQERECHGGNDDDTGFDEELPDNAAYTAAHYFPDAYLFCPQYRLRRGQVDKVDSGNDQDEKGNAGQCKQRRLMRPAAVSILISRIKMDVCQRLQRQAGFHTGTVFVPLEEGGELLFRLGDCRAGSQLNIDIDTASRHVPSFSM